MTYTCAEGVWCNAVVVEVGVGAPLRVGCPNFQGKLPNKLGELLSSMYLIGVASTLAKLLVQIKTYGWLVIRGQFGMGIEMTMSHVKIMF